MGAATTRIACEVDLDRPGKHCGHLRVPNSVNESAYGTVLIPIWVIAGGTGPTVLFTGGVHGDEYEGPVALMKTARRLDPAQLSGRVIIIPCLNTPAVTAGTRLSPLDGLNLNRIFPGDRDGSVSMMIAHYIDTLILPLVDCQIDLHSGGKTLDFLPMIGMKESPDKERERATRELALAFGAPYTLLNRDLDETGLLESACEARGIMHLGSELGGAGRIARANVAIAEYGITNVLRHLAILPGEATKSPTRLIEVEDMRSYAMAPAAGILEPFAEIGDEVEAGAVIGQIHTPDDALADPVMLAAERSGLLFCRRPLGDVRRGDTVAIIARDIG